MLYDVVNWCVPLTRGCRCEVDKYCRVKYSGSGGVKGSKVRVFKPTGRLTAAVFPSKLASSRKKRASGNV